MAVNQQIYLNGIRGLLSHYEIDTLPEDYEIYKSMFHDTTKRHDNEDFKPKNDSIITRIIKKFLCLRKNTI